MDSVQVTLSRLDLLRYGAFGMPLALVSLPIHVYLPQFYAERFGLSLAAIGALLLAVRLFDAFLDPLIGIWIDKLQAGYGRWILVSLPFLAFGFVGLFHPPALANAAPLGWLLSALATVYIGFSVATIAYQSWGVSLTQRPGERTRLSAVREGWGLAGVLLAAVLPTMMGIDALLMVFAVAVIVSGTLLTTAPRHAARRTIGTIDIKRSALLPFRDARFRWLFAVFVLNGIAAAIPATLFMFFAQDRLQLGAYAGPFLIAYFAAAALSMPGWAMLAKRHGEARAWLGGMLLSAIAFIWAYGLPAGSLVPFAAICVVSGMALGADLALPAALLAAVIGRAGHQNQHEGAYFGAWNWATKLNLALAAGIALPLLERLGYLPGAVAPGALNALAFAYAVLPCLLKCVAALLLWRAPLRHL